MLTQDIIANIMGTIRTASASTESRFLDIGRRLESSAEILGRLTESFGQLATEMAGDNLRQATRDLLQIAARVPGLAQNHHGERSSFARLTELTVAVENRVARMAKAVNNVGSLTVNARIAAHDIGSAGADFLNFATEIGRTLQQAHASLGQFTSELGNVGRQVGSASGRQLVLEERQAATARTIPARLAASVNAIAARGNGAGGAAATVGERSQRVVQRIGQAVTALQVGDITRQRVEHVDYALGILADITAASGDWAALTPTERDVLAARCGRLQAAQLVDTADEFDHEVGQILSSLQDLAADAHTILRLGSTAFGASGTRRGSFLGELAQEVGEVDALLNGFRTARNEADQVASAVSDATTSLASHIGSVRTVEADIRIMALNTTLKCGRLGPAGRPLAVIAQELRVYSHQIATEASAVTTDLGQVTTIAGALSAGAQDGKTTEIAAIADIMAQSVSRLDAAGQSLADALTRLEHDGTNVAALLQETASRMVLHEEISRVLRQAAAELAKIAASDGEDTDSALDRMLALLAHSYTMERERVIHDRHSGRAPIIRAAAPAVAVDAMSVLEDMLF